MAKELTKKDIEKIVSDEIKKYQSDKLDDDIHKLFNNSNTKTRRLLRDLMKDAISKLAEFLYIRRNVWQNDIK